jgi:palmitoyltransferase ZDHHC9/14/18
MFHNPDCIYKADSQVFVRIDILLVHRFGLPRSRYVDRLEIMLTRGLLPRSLDTDPPMARAQSDSYELPLDRTFAIGNGRQVDLDNLGLTISVTVRWCDTCRTYRPPRSSHCRLVSLAGLYVAELTS